MDSSVSLLFHVYQFGTGLAILRGSMKITRKQAEDLITSTQVISTTLKQKHDEIKIRMQLSNSQTFVVTYDLVTHVKSYNTEP